MYNFVAKHKKTAVALLGFMLLASFFGLKFIKYNNNIESMLPQDSQVQQSMRFLRESNFSDKLVISLRLTDQKHTSDNLIFEADKLAASLNSPLIRQVISSVSGANLMQEAIFFLQFCPQLINADSLPELNAKLTPDKIKERLSSIYRQSLSPGSAFTIPFMRADPLNLYSGILSDIQKLSQASGYNVTLNNGHLISQDGSSTMIIVKTSVLLTEGFGSRKIVSYLQEKLKQLPAYIRADIIAGHMHTVKNEEIIKNDIRLTTTIAAIGFILLFLFIFRDWRALIIFLMPLGAVLITTAVTFQIFKELSYFVIGLSTVIAGITIDYGIYVYMAVRKSGNSSATINKIRKPMLFGALTTISIFIVFFFSSVRGYHQLAFFSNFAIILCLIFVQFFLPHFIKQEPFLSAKAQEKPAGKINFRISDRLLFLTWIILMIIALGLSSRVKFNNDINQFDGAGREVERSENEFHKTWGSKELPAVFVISAANLEEAYNLNHQVYSQAIKIILTVLPQSGRG